MNDKNEPSLSKYKNTPKLLFSSCFHGNLERLAIRNRVKTIIKSGNLMQKPYAGFLCHTPHRQTRNVRNKNLSNNESSYTLSTNITTLITEL